MRYDATRNEASVTNAKLDNVTYDRLARLNLSLARFFRRYQFTKIYRQTELLMRREPSENKKQTRSVLCVIGAINARRFRRFPLCASALRLTDDSSILPFLLTNKRFRGIGTYSPAHRERERERERARNFGDRFRSSLGEGMKEKEGGLKI